MENSSTSKQGFNWSEFLSFRKMIALQIIQILYIVVAALITLGGLTMLFRTNDYGYGGGFMAGSKVGALLLIVLGNVFWRLWCEFIIVLFRINQTLISIDKKSSNAVLQ